MPCPNLQLDVNGSHAAQHTGDEMYHPTLGGYSPEWSADER